MKGLDLWKQVEKTDPKYTKSFSRAGGFSGTAINATYLIRRATELWGPMGGDWGHEVADEKYVPGHGDTVIHVLRIKFRHPHGIVEAYGQTTFVGTNKNGPFTDEEAPKKSLTDAITKALSMLGFAADVHLGLFDDNKYVNDRKAELASVKPVSQDEWEKLTDERRDYLSSIAREVKTYIKNGNPAGGVQHVREKVTDTTEQVAIWSLFDSAERAAMEPNKRPKKAA